MKKTLTISMILIGMSTGAYAHCCNEPKPETCPKVKTKVITKTVEKPVHVFVEKPVVVEKEVVKVVDRPVPVRVTQTVVKKVQKKNRINALAGMGPTNISITQSTVNLERGLILGVQYQRMLDDSLSIGIQVQSNETTLGIVGIDF
jgi:outer membrane biosynthesis protein TonB